MVDINDTDCTSFIVAPPPTLALVVFVGGGTTTLDDDLDVEELGVLDLLLLVLLLVVLLKGFQPTLFGLGCNFSARAISTGRDDAIMTS